ncbi:MAG: hypothetical protein K0S19_569 [Geminicoccaceae bacterium]|nr:hypothetical protein [Geminicoccaceae bacterium]
MSCRSSTTRPQLHDRLAIGRIEVSGRLVGQQNGGIAGHRSGHGHPLLLAARELGGKVLHPVGHPDPFQGRLHSALPVFSGKPPIRERQLDVLVNGEIADQVEGLENESDLAIPNPGPLRWREPGDRLLVERVDAIGGRVEQAQDGEQRRLAASRGARNGDVFAVPDLQVNVREGMGLHLVGVEHLLDGLQADERSSGSHGDPGLLGYWLLAVG